MQLINRDIRVPRFSTTLHNIDAIWTFCTTIDSNISHEYVEPIYLHHTEHSIQNTNRYVS